MKNVYLTSKSEMPNNTLLSYYLSWLKKVMKDKKYTTVRNIWKDMIRSNKVYNIL
jgi:hypothetical protein